MRISNKQASKMRRKNNMIYCGIDLAGSPKRNTGICFLNKENSIVLCTTVHSDEEILSLTKKYEPKVVAIDAPLSLPKGRKSIDERSNIHFRKCDLELRKMGIKFFPITLGPMRILTKRGIEIKKKLEKLGFIVIETFPGAVQDILGIPRKTKGREKLLEGIKKLGIKGVKDDFNSDELDAITCAIIAKLYDEKNYLEIGDKNEGTIILPKV